MSRYIDADEAKENLKKLIRPNTSADKLRLFNFTIKILDATPTADVSEKEYGYWTYDSEMDTKRCSNCGVEYDTLFMPLNCKYCPECGVKIKGEIK